MKQRFGSYEILHELKSGGMGSVLLARRRGPGAFEQLVAIKTIRPEFAGASHVRAMFLDEAAILARINHPAIATVHDFGEEGGTLYMVMEYVAGLPFRELVDSKPPPVVIARAIVEACRGLHAAHELHDLAGNPLELVHRDISPDNLMLGFDGHVKVIDFGIALVKKHRQAPVTELGTIKGKPPYMSPEQVANEAMDRRSDVFSLAVVGWELLTGRPLFEGDSIYHVAIAVAQQDILPPSQASGRVLPEGLDDALMRALERDVAKRTSTAARFAEELEQVIQRAGGQTLEAWSDRELARQRDDHRRWLASVIEGDALPRVIGRATGQVTELAPIADTPMAGAPAEPIAAVAPLAAPEVAQTPTSIGGDEDGLSIPPRTRIAPVVILLAALLVAGIAAFVVMRPAKRTPRQDAAVALAPEAHDAPPNIPLAPDASTQADADVAVPARVDAAVRTRVDAGGRAVRLDASAKPPPDAASKPAPDAAVVAAPTGTGIVNIRFKQGLYANISIDGSNPVAGPLLNRSLPAGKHTISFHDPKTGETLDTQVIEVTPGGKHDVRQR